MDRLNPKDESGEELSISPDLSGEQFEEGSWD